MWRKKRGTARSFVGVYGTSQRGRLGAKTCSVCRHVDISALETETCDGSIRISWRFCLGAFFSCFYMRFAFVFFLVVCGLFLYFVILALYCARWPGVERLILGWAILQKSSWHSSTLKIARRQV